ncbi:MAG: hypothetical protein ACK4PR_08380 [Gammaproteobacteria bacterium]
MKSTTDCIINTLRQTVVKMQLILNAIDEPIVWTDETGMISWYNNTFQNFIKHLPIKLLGHNLAEIIPLTQHNTRVELAFYPHHQALRSDTIFQATYEYTFADQIKQLKISSYAMTSESNEKYVISILHDMTNQNLSSPSTQHVATLGKMINEMTKELTQLLTTVRNNMQTWKLLPKDKMTEQDIETLTATTIHQVDNAITLINDLRAYAANQGRSF